MASNGNPGESLSSTIFYVFKSLILNVDIGDADANEAMMKHFDFPTDDPYNFDLKPLSDGAGDFYGFPSDVFNVFNLNTGG